MKKIIAVLLSVSMLFLLGCTAKKTDMDKLVGTWKNEEKQWQIKFYEPDDEENTGDIEILSYDDSTIGSYVWHENSKRIDLLIIDNWGSSVSVTYNYEIVDDNHLKISDDEDSLELTRVE